MELCLLLCGSLDGREVWGRMDICVCLYIYIYIYIYIYTYILAEFLHSSPETHNIAYQLYPIQNKKVKIN